jgi:aspartyl-tRNA(Asn)/glutamyl-tRNA(Gln) amidotransferase subunit B
MEKGHLRADANVSVRLKGAEKFGIRAEVKNLNSFRFLKQAIEFEIARQVAIAESGGRMIQETRLFDPETGETAGMRSKEDAHDYRYFPEPDLPPVFVTQEYIDAIRKEMPPLPDELFRKYTSELKLSEYDASVLTDNKWDILYFEELIRHTKNVKAAANWMMGAIKSYMNEQGITIREFPLKPETLGALITIIDEGKVSNTVAAQEIFPALIKDASASPLEVAQRLNLIQESDSGAIEAIVDEVLKNFPDEVEKYKGGKVNLLQMFVGQVMKASKGKADPKVATEIVKKKLEA